MIYSYLFFAVNTVSYPISFGNVADDLTSCWVDGGESLPTSCILPLIVDEQLKETFRRVIAGFTFTPKQNLLMKGGKNY